MKKISLHFLIYFCKKRYKCCEKIYVWKEKQERKRKFEMVFPAPADFFSAKQGNIRNDI